MKSEEANRLKFLRDVNRQVKQLVADQALDNQMLKHVASGNHRGGPVGAEVHSSSRGLLSFPARRWGATGNHIDAGLPNRNRCRISRSTQYPDAKACRTDSDPAARLVRDVVRKLCFGNRVHAFMLSSIRRGLCSGLDGSFQQRFGQRGRIQ